MFSLKREDVLSRNRSYCTGWRSHFPCGFMLTKVTKRAYWLWWFVYRPIRLLFSLYFTELMFVSVIHQTRCIGLCSWLNEPRGTNPILGGSGCYVDRHLTMYRIWFYIYMYTLVDITFYALLLYTPPPFTYFHSNLHNVLLNVCS